MLASGQSKDNPNVDAAEKARLRMQAHGWLKENLAEYADTLQADANKAKMVLTQLQRWQKDSDLTTVCAPKELAQLPVAERKCQWEALWSEVRELGGESQRGGRGELVLIFRLRRSAWSQPTPQAKSGNF